MKVLHVLSAIDPRYGGPSTSLVGLARAQRRAGLEVGITATHYWELPVWPELESLEETGCILHLHHCPPRTGHGATKYRTQLEHDIQQSDVVHIHALWHAEQRLAAYYAYKHNTPYLFRTCGMLAPWSMSQSRWKKIVYLFAVLRSHLRRASRIHFTTKRESNASLRYALPAQVIVEPNGLCREEYQSLPSAGAFRSKYGIADSHKIALFLGRVHPKKGLALLLGAFSQFQCGLLVIAGPDNDGYTSQLMREADHLGIATRVRFVGPLHGVNRLAAFQDSNVFVLPSYHENFGNTVIESLACGTPVIISDQVDLCDDLQDTAVAQVVKLDTNSLVWALSKYLSADSLPHSAKRCREFVFARYDWDTIARRWAGHYDKLVSERAKAVGDDD